MPSIVGKRQGNQTYYYLVESARVDGKPRIVSQQYLGSAEEVAAKLAGSSVGEPVRTQHKKFGDLAAVWSVLERLDVAGVIDAVAPRYANAAASVGSYICLATANRVVDPCSKLAFADWWASTAGPRFTGLSGPMLDHRRFWDAMDRLVQRQLDAIESELGRRMVSEFGLDLSGLVLDMTNFATYIDTANAKAPIAQRGKAKQKRTDLRLVGLALVVTRDGGIPLLSHAYAGDRPDVTQFAAVVAELVARYRQVAGSVESLTMVYDAGQNSAANHALVEASELGFVGSLPPADHPALLGIPAARYAPVDAQRYPGLACVDTEVTALGVARRAVLTHSATLHAKQTRGLDQTLAKARRRLAALQATLARGKTRRDRDAVQAEITAICQPRWVSQVLTTNLAGDTPAELRLSFRTNTRARQTLENTLFGKRILFTNRDHWPVTDVIAVLPIPERGRVRVPADERPPRGLLRPDAPLDRLQNPRPRLLQRPGPHHRPPNAPRSRTRRPAPVRPRTTRHPGRHPRNRAALPRRRQRPPPRPADAHRHRPHPATPGRPVRHPPLRTHPLTSHHQLR